MGAPPAVSLTVFEQSAPDREWREIAELFAACFSAAPYFEDRHELETIVSWGPAMLAGEGRLVTARSDGVLAGFALGHSLAHDLPWQATVTRLADEGRLPREALARFDDSFIVHELAVSEAERGRGLARSCIGELLAGRPEACTLVGAYDRATAARDMYRRWGFEPVGQVPLQGEAISLHVLRSATQDAVARLRAAARFGAGSAGGRPDAGARPHDAHG